MYQNGRNLLGQISSFVRKLRHSCTFEDDGQLNVVKSYQIIDAVCQHFHVMAFEDLGVGNPFSVDSIREVIELERRIWAFVSAYVASRGIATIYECETEFLLHEQCQEFAELEIGNSFFLTEAVVNFFLVPQSMQSVRSITTVDIVRSLKELRARGSAGGSIGNRIEISDVAVYLCQKYEVIRLEELGVRITYLGLYLGMLRHVERSEKNKLQELNLEFQKDVAEKVFAITKVKFSEESKRKAVDESLRGVKRKDQEKLNYGSNRIANIQSRLSSDVLQHVTSLDSFLDKMVSKHSELLPSNSISMISHHDLTIRKQLLKNKSFTIKSKVVCWVLCSCLAKVQVLLETNLPTSKRKDSSDDSDEEECDCCCVGRDSCECKCSCDCHDLSEKNDAISISSSSESESEQIIESDKVKPANKQAPAFYDFEKEFHDYWKSNPFNGSSVGEFVKYLVSLENQMCKKKYINQERDSSSFSIIQLMANLKMDFFQGSINSSKLNRKAKPAVSKKMMHMFLEQCYGLRSCTDSDSNQLLEKLLTECFKVNSVENLGYQSVDIDGYVKELGNRKSPYFFGKSALIFSTLLDGVQGVSFPKLTTPKSQIIEIFLRMQYMVDINTYFNWCETFETTHGNLSNFIVENLTKKGFFAIQLQSRSLVRIKDTSTPSDFHASALRNDGVEVGTHFVSIFVKSGGLLSFPSKLMKSYLETALLTIRNLDVFLTFIADALLTIPFDFVSRFIDILLPCVKKLDLVGGSDVFELLVHHSSKPDIKKKLLCIGSVFSNPTVTLEKGLMKLLKQHPSHPFASEMPDNLISSSEAIEKPVEEDINKIVSHEKCGNPEDFNLPSSIDRSMCKHVINQIRKNQFGIGVNISGEGCAVLLAQQKRLDRALKRLSEELYSESLHFVLELVQNADDNVYLDNVVPKIELCVKENRLVYKNNEVGFTKENISAVCDIGASTKVSTSTECIGKKGIGFKSVFKVTNCPEIHSNGYHIKFLAHEDNLNDSRLGYIVPHWIEDSSLHINEPGTTLILPLLNDIVTKSHTKQSFLSRLFDFKPAALLFLKKIQQIKIVDENTAKLTYIRKKVSRKITESHQCIEINFNGNSHEWEVFKMHVTVPPGVKKKEVSQSTSSTELCIAFPSVVGTNQSLHFQLQDVCAYLPLRSYGFRFLIQADFEVPSSREAILCENQWNEYLLSQLPAMFTSSLGHFRTKELISSFYSFIPLVDEIQHPFESVASEICLQLRDLNCVLNRDNQWVHPNSVFLTQNFDEIGKLLPSAVMNKVFGKNWHHPNVKIPSGIAVILGIEVFSLQNLFQVCTFIGNQQIEVTISWLADFVYTLFHMAFESYQLTELMDRIPFLKVFPAERSEHNEIQLVSLNKQWPYFIPSTLNEDQEVHLSFSSELLLINSTFVTELRRLDKNSMIENTLLENSFLKTIATHDIIFHHITPKFVKASMPLESQVSSVNSSYDKYVIFLANHFHACDSCRSNCSLITTLKEHIILQVSSGRQLKMSNQMFFSPSAEEIHFLPNKYDSSVDVINGSQFNLVSSTYFSSSCKENLIRFFKLLDMKDVLSIYRDETCFVSPGFTYIIGDSSNKMDANSKLIMMNSIALIFDRIWKSEFSTASSNPYAISNVLQHTKWILGKDGNLYQPSELWLPTDANMKLFKDIVMFVDAALKNNLFLNDLKFNTDHTLSVKKVLDVLVSLSKRPTAMTSQHFNSVVNIYTFLQQEVSKETKSLIRKMFNVHSILLVKKKKKRFKFILSNETVWNDEELLSKGTKSYSLSSIYPHSLKSFFLEFCNVSENPSFSLILARLEELHSSNPVDFPHLSLPLLKKFSERYFEKPSNFSSQEKTNFLDKLKKLILHWPIFPCMRNKWVCLNEDFLIWNVQEFELFGNELIISILDSKNVLFLNEFQPAFFDSEIVNLLKVLGVPVFTINVVKDVQKWCDFLVFLVNCSSLEHIVKLNFLRVFLDIWLQEFVLQDSGVNVKSDTLKAIQRSLFYARIFPAQNKLSFYPANQLFFNDRPDVDAPELISLLHIDPYVVQDNARMWNFLESCGIKSMKKTMDEELTVDGKAIPNIDLKSRIVNVLPYSIGYLKVHHPSIFDMYALPELLPIISALKQIDCYNVVGMVLNCRLERQVQFNLYREVYYKINKSQQGANGLYVTDSGSTNYYSIFYEILQQLFPSISTEILSSMTNFLFVVSMKRNEIGVCALEEWLQKTHNFTSATVNDLLGLPLTEKERATNSGCKKRKLVEINTQLDHTTESTSIKRIRDQIMMARSSHMICNSNINEVSFLGPVNTLSLEKRQLIGKLGEECVFHYLLLQEKMSQNHSIADNKEIVWVNQDEESGKPYDLEIHSSSTSEVQYIEVKSTKSWNKSYFELSLNEIDFARQHGSNYFIYRLYNVPCDSSNFNPENALIELVEKASTLSNSSIQLQVYRNPIALVRQKILKLLMSSSV